MRQSYAVIAARCEADYGVPLEQLLREMFAEGHALAVIAGVIGASSRFVGDHVRRLGLSRPAITLCRARPTMQLAPQVCGDRIGERMTYREIAVKYRISSASIAQILRRHAPDFIGSTSEPVFVRPPVYSPEERARRAARARANGGRRTRCGC